MKAKCSRCGKIYTFTRSSEEGQILKSKHSVKCIKCNYVSVNKVPSKGLRKNKYYKESIESQNRRKIERACGNKKAYDTLEEANNNKGQTAYKCRYCGKWHRTTNKDSYVKIMKKGY